MKVIYTRTMRVKDDGLGKIGRAHVRTPVTSQSRMPSSA